MTKLGIIGAMDVEVETLLSEMEQVASTKKAGSTFHEGVLMGLPVVLVQCGVGKVNAALCVQIMCDCFGVTHLVNTGIAGSLCAELDIGDLVVSRDAMYHDFDCTHFGYPFGKVPGNPGHTRVGRVASGDQFVADPAVKEKIVANTRGLCTEMEGAAIAQTAYRNSVPFVILRAISDKADDSAEMDYPTFEKIAAHRCAEVTCRLAKHLHEAEMMN